MIPSGFVVIFATGGWRCPDNFRIMNFLAPFLGRVRVEEICYHDRQAMEVWQVARQHLDGGDLFRPIPPLLVVMKGGGMVWAVKNPTNEQLEEARALLLAEDDALPP